MRDDEDEAYSRSIGESPNNNMRNRYYFLMPYNSNRVVLDSTPNNPDGYINASHISFPEISIKYIASQGPLPNTVEEFLQMICQYKIKVIAMLCKSVESNYSKCEQYWPKSKGETKNFGSFTVTYVNEQTFKEYSHRSLFIESEKYGKVKVEQMHYNEWPDFGCPRNEKYILEFIEKMNSLHTNDSPILVHCSAGCGRTGTVIALNIIREQLLNKKKPLSQINVKQLIYDLREQRVNMVETQEQFELLQKCIEAYAKK